MTFYLTAGHVTKQEHGGDQEVDEGMKMPILLVNYVFLTPKNIEYEA